MRTGIASESLPKMSYQGRQVMVWCLKAEGVNYRIGLSRV